MTPEDYRKLNRQITAILLLLAALCLGLLVAGRFVPFDLTVTNQAPVFTSTAVTAAVESSAYSDSITTSDADAGDTRSITAPTKPAWLTLSDNGDGTATLSGTPAIVRWEAKVWRLSRARDNRHYPDCRIIPRHRGRHRQVRASGML